LEASYVKSSEQAFRYADEGMSAAKITASNSAKMLNISKGLAKVNIATGIITTGYSYYKIGDALDDPTKSVNKKDIADATVGTVSTTVAVFAFIGTVSNPIGWGVGLCAGAYFIYRAFDD
jgi:hypothetical protein